MELDDLIKFNSFYDDKILQLNNSIIEDKSKLSIYEENLDKMNKIDLELADSSKLLEILGDHIQTFSNIIKICVKKKAKFKDVRKNLIEQEIENNLRYLYPDKNYDVSILFGEYRGNDTAELLLGQQGDYAPLTGQNGMFVRQITSLVGMQCINKLHGGSLLLLDEALASSDKDNLLKLKPMFERILDDKFQVIMIEHKPEIYKNLKYKKIHLVRNESKGVYVDNITYSEGE